MRQIGTFNSTPSGRSSRDSMRFFTSCGLLIFLFALMAGCEEPGREVYNLNGELLDDELSPRISAIIDQERDRYDAPNWIPKPNTEIVVKDEITNDSAVSVGIESSYLDIINYAAITEMRLNFGWSAYLTIWRGGLDPIMVYGNGNVPELNFQENVPFIGFCSYQASMNTGMALRGSVKIMGNGVQNVTTFNDAISVTRNGETFYILEGDTIRSLMELCHEDFRRQHRSNTIRDLRLVYKASSSPDYTYDKNDHKKGILAALYGPEQKRLKIHGHHWNVKPAKIAFNGDWVYLDGQISHNIRFRRDHQLYYKCEYRNGQRTSISYNYNGDKSWKKAARRLAGEICDEAYLFYREPADAPPVEGDVEVFKHDHYREKQASIPMGKHRLSDLRSFGLVNDDISSIKIPYGMKVIAYEHDNFSGRVRAYTSNQNRLSSSRMNDNISSMIVAKTGI